MLPEVRLFVSFLLFFKDRSSQHSCSNNLRCISSTSGQHNHTTCSPTCPPDLWSISFRSLWGWTVTQVLDPATNHSLLLFEDFTGEVPPGPGPAPIMPPLTTSMVWDLQANPPRSHCLLPWQSVYFQFPAHIFSSFPSTS